MLDSQPTPRRAAFDMLLDKFAAAKPVGTDDVVGAIRALLEEVRDLHDDGRVAELDRVDLIGLTEGGELQLGACPVGTPAVNDVHVRQIEAPRSEAVAIVRQIGVREDSGVVAAAWDRGIAEPGDEPDRPLFYRNYGSWERAVGQHDALTDIFHLGLIAGSLATGLDFRDAGQFSVFVQNRSNLLRLNPRLHPVLARAIADMTEPVRSQRAADLGALIDLIDDYRSVEVDDATSRQRDLAAFDDPDVRRQRMQAYFRNRLFEVSKRNKLLYYSDKHGVDLTRGSFPLLLDYRTLKARQLLTTNAELLGQLAARNDGSAAVGELDLRRWLQCVDYPFLAPSLDKVRATARKDLRELGFNQLRLVLAMLHWSEDEKGERLHSPLVMLPVTLKKQAGTADGFSLMIERAVAEAEINPVLRYVLAEKFKIALPETIDMRDLAAITDLRATLERDMRRVRAGVAVAMIDKPRVQLIQKTIKRQLDEHRRRHKRAGQQIRDWRGVSYSYAAESYQPLGYELYDRFVRPKAAPGREFANGKGAVDSGVAVAGEETATAETYAFESVEKNDPLNWEIDLCAVSLANFNTRKMSLVRDYETLLDGYTGRHANYQRLFEHGARPQLSAMARPRHSERNFVLPSDSSQDDAILRAATGESYVIQGPPGTGKSQTIANLLAELAARGKSVLFVCEKRVALDVVHNRLKEAGLGELACLIHDAGEDRIEFIADLKRLYETWSHARGSRTVRDKREKLASEIDGVVGQLEAFSKAMQSPAGQAGPVNALMAYAIAEQIGPLDLSSGEREKVPSWDAFRAGEAELRQVDAFVQGLGDERPSVAALTGVLRTDFAATERPVAFLEGAVPEARAGLGQIAALGKSAVAVGDTVTIGDVAVQAKLATELRVLAEAGRLNLIDRLNADAIRFQKQAQVLDKLEAALAAATAPNGDWTQKLAPAETDAALVLARQKEGRFLSFLSGDWRALRRTIGERYSGSQTSVVVLLEQLAAEHAARAARDECIASIRQNFDIDEIGEVRAAIDAAWRDGAGKPAAEVALIEACVGDPKGKARAVLQLANDHAAMQRATATLDKLFVRYASVTAVDLAARLSTLDRLKDRSVELARRIGALEKAAPELARAWRDLQYDVGRFRAAALHTTIARALSGAGEAQHMTAAALQARADDLGGRLAELRQLNAKRTVEDQRAQFKQQMAAKNKAYDAGRAFLEHQFSLQRPSAAMREFLAGDPGRVLRDLKPIWMMSPLSVADTLPLHDQLFDVVVFDEASQIPIEDAVPTLYRAPQTIVVGDEMQLPPPSYFAKKLETDGEDLPDYIAFGMQAESLLDKAVVALPSTRLDWHYRSRHEGLIGFCNQAFYAGQLKTIPSRQLLEPMASIDTTATLNMKQQAALVLERPISFHKIEGGIFAGQQNLKEAGYIAELVKTLLSQNGEMSIGIVAFSQPQQAAIEEALERIASGNQTFRARLDQALGLEHEELFVKNLENVQGDERDIMIVSVAYAPNAGGRLIMNFGPINQEGGEKRLNVIFSRAKHHMVVVTSIDASQITNDYNKGANALKRYLMYAAAASKGDLETMRTALSGYPGAENVERAVQFNDPLADALAEQQRAAGVEAVRAFGQSTARCDVALRDAGAPLFGTAVLTDNVAHYEVADVVDRYVTYPGLLRASGWKVRFALAKDWLAGKSL